MKVKLYLIEELAECEFMYCGVAYIVNGKGCFRLGQVEKLPSIKLAIYHWHPRLNKLQIPTRESSLKEKFDAIVFEGDYSADKFKKAEYIVKVMNENKAKEGK